MRSALLAIVLLASIPNPIVADVCPCVPVTHLWAVKTCADWNCASTELAVANGNAEVFAVPYAIDDKRWVVLTRVTSGDYLPDTSDPFQVEEFDGMPAAAFRYGNIAADHHPMLVTSPDGKILVMSLRTQAEPRHRASGTSTTHR